MEMSSSCPRPVQTQEDDLPREVRKPVRGPHGGWQKSEIDALRARIEQAEHSGESLRSVFEEVAKDLGRKPNSIRNFYYAQLRGQEGGAASRALPFETFTPQEVEQLIESVLTARAQGLSVRACVRNLSGGDRTRMLRYQNKYRSIVRTRPELVRRVMDRLAESGTPYVSPYPGETAAPAPERIEAVKVRARESGDPQIAQLFESLDHLLDLALDPPAPPPIGPQDAEALRRADRLKAQCDVLRIALDDEQTRAQHLREETAGMVTIIKEYIALPQADRVTHCQAFCQQAAAQLSAVECALMNEL